MRELRVGDKVTLKPYHQGTTNLNHRWYRKNYGKVFEVYADEDNDEYVVLEGVGYWYIDNQWKEDFKLFNIKFIGGDDE